MRKCLHGVCGIEWNFETLDRRMPSTRKLKHRQRIHDASLLLGVWAKTLGSATVMQTNKVSTRPEATPQSSFLVGRDVRE